MCARKKEDPCISRPLFLLAILTICIFSSSCGLVRASLQTAAAPNPDTLLRVAQDYGKTIPPDALWHASTDAGAPKVDPKDNDEADFIADIAATLYQRDFDTLEKIAGDARDRKTRFAGGSWKLTDFYLSIQAPRGRR
jgi:hypothetical protein